MLHNITGQSEQCMQKDSEKDLPPSADPNDSKLAEYATSRIVGHCGLKQQTEYEVECYGYRAESSTFEPALELRDSFSRRQ